MAIFFPFFKQHDQKDCGPTCLKMIAKKYGRSFKIQKLREYCQINKQGVNLLGISEAAEKIGFRTMGTQIRGSQLKEVELPCILHWDGKHFVVLYKIKKRKYYIADPALGLVQLSEKDFLSHWIFEGSKQGTALLLTPSPYFYEFSNDSEEKLNWSFMIRYLTAHRQLILQLFLGLILGTLIQLITPFLTQSVVDIGINTRNLSFINMILVAQLLIFLGSSSVTFIRSWVLLHLTTRINISILTDFLIKLMRLPMSFYESRTAGDIMQRMGDQGRIESFLTGSTMGTLFSMLNMLIFAFVLAYYNIRYICYQYGCLYALDLILFKIKKETGLSEVRQFRYESD